MNKQINEVEKELFKRLVADKKVKWCSECDQYHSADGVIADDIVNFLQEKLVTTEQKQAIDIEQVAENVVLLVIIIRELILKMEHFISKSDNLAAIRMSDQIKANLMLLKNCRKEFNERFKQPKG